MKLTTAKVNWSNCPDTFTVKSESSKGWVTPLRNNNSIEDWLQCQQSLHTRANLGFICSKNAQFCCPRSARFSSTHYFNFFNVLSISNPYLLRAGKEYYRRDTRLLTHSTAHCLTCHCNIQNEINNRQVKLEQLSGSSLTVKSRSSKGGVTPLRHNNSIEDWLQCQQSLHTRANLGFMCSNNVRSLRLLKMDCEVDFN
ncbi:hypothetical protein CDAR_191981 [Caerostris darwini]|uniref:Uncharacterized protein n=1 Tax=Caerostris darwini TaxID=1538125 RepID=A0AAV4NP19_9ARAC|nr:hypothetical protein CDAR_191981 [Caerostris darwini]